MWGSESAFPQKVETLRDALRQTQDKLRVTCERWHEKTGETWHSIILETSCSCAGAHLQATRPVIGIASIMQFARRIQNHGESGQFHGGVPADAR